MKKKKNKINDNLNKVQHETNQSAVNLYFLISLKKKIDNYMNKSPKTEIIKYANM